MGMQFLKQSLRATAAITAVSVALVAAPSVGNAATFNLSDLFGTNDPAPGTNQPRLGSISPDPALSSSQTVVSNTYINDLTLPVIFTNATGSGSADCFTCLQFTRFGLSLIEDDTTVNSNFTTTSGTAGQSGSGQGPMNLLSPISPGGEFNVVFRVGDNVPNSLLNDYELGTREINANYSFDLTVVPLPAAGWLLLTALGGLAVAARRKKAAEA